MISFLNPKIQKWRITQMKTHLNGVASFPGDFLAYDDFEDSVSQLELFTFCVEKFCRCFLYNVNENRLRNSH